jgi:GNAT superfamily N-acetyltransferase
LKGWIGMGLNYRKATLQDEEELFTLAARLATSFILDKGVFSTIYKDILVNRNADLLIAEKESRIIGYGLVFHHATFYANGVISWVEELFVLEEYRRMKIGKKLMEIIEGRAFERGSKLVALATRRAGVFYNSIGYDECATYFKKTLSSN